MNKIFIKNLSLTGLSILFIFIFTSNFSISFFNLSEIGLKRLIIFLMINFIFIFRKEQNHNKHISKKNGYTWDIMGIHGRQWFLIKILLKFNYLSKLTLDIYHK